jgi:hypothetical protein
MPDMQPARGTVTGQNPVFLGMLNQIKLELVASFLRGLEGV